MTMSRVEDLWTRFLSEGTLPASDERDLVRALEADPALRARILRDKELDGLLDAVHANERDLETFCKSFEDRLAFERDDSAFVARVEEKIRRVPPKRSGRLRRFAGGGSSAPISRALALTAAGVLAVLLLSILATRSDPPSRVTRSPEPQTPQERAPEVPLQVDAPRPKSPEVLPKREEIAPPIQREAARIEHPPEAPPEVPPTPVPVEAPEKPATPPRPRTEVIVARVVKTEGDVRGAASDVAAGGGLETGSRSSAQLVYPDGTRFELGAQTALADIVDVAGKGKGLRLERGTLTADVVRQPQGQPVILRTPHAELLVLGTTFRVTLENASTRLDVMSGKVRMLRLTDGKSVDVISGQYAVAGAGLDLVAKSSATKAKSVLLQESFQNPKDVEARWKAIGTGAVLKTAGQLEIDLSPAASNADGWTGAGLLSRQTFAAPMAVSMDVDVPVLHPSVVAALVFIPQGQKRGGSGVFRIQLRGARYTLTSEAGEPRELSGADRAGGAPCRERWKVEVDGAAVRFLVNDREVFRTKHELPISAGYGLGIDASARADAPSGAKAGFDNLLVEPLK
ncbi:MAG TPA: FecR family protein [Planctomycetota bacterium]|nr:FecR family protein [Planctomycetota bacterium]